MTLKVITLPVRPKISQETIVQNFFCAKNFKSDFITHFHGKFATKKFLTRLSSMLTNQLFSTIRGKVYFSFFNTE